MIFFPSMDIIVQIGSFALRWYPVCLLTGFFLMYYLAGKQLTKIGYSEKLIDTMFIMCVVWGIIGARLWYVIFVPNNQMYFSNPILIIQVWNGGLAIQGAIVGASIYLANLAKRNNLDLRRMLDAIFPSILLAQIIGRWGNFFNQEAYGPVVSENYFNWLPNFIKEGMYIVGAYRMPMFLLEGILNALGFMLIYTFYKRYLVKKRGDYTYAYLAVTGLIRFYIESLRTDSLMIGPFKSAQVTSLLFIGIGLFGYFGGYDRWIKSNKPIILFDLDGTLIDTRVVISATYQKLMNKYNPGRTLSETELDEVFGPPLIEGLTKYFPFIPYPDIDLEYRELNAKLQKQQLKAIDGAKELLIQLKNDGYLVGIVSNKTHQAIEFSLDICQLSELVAVSVGVDQVKKAKPHPQGIFLACQLLNMGCDDVIYIGDSVNDVRCGINAGVYTIAYLEYPQRKAALLAANPNRLISEPNELLAILKEKHSWTSNMM